MNTNEINTNEINTNEKLCDDDKLAIYDIIEELNCTLQHAKIIYKYSNQYDLLYYDTIYDLLYTFHSIDYIDSIFDIIICNNMKEYNVISAPQSSTVHNAMFNIMTCKHMYRCNYAYDKYYKSPYKENVINFAIQYFKLFKSVCGINEYNLNYMKSRAIESGEEQFIQLFNEI